MNRLPSSWGNNRWWCEVIAKRLWFTSWTATSPRRPLSVVCASALCQLSLISWEPSVRELVSSWPSPSSTSTLKSSSKNRVKWEAWAHYSSKKAAEAREIKEETTQRRVLTSLRHERSERKKKKTNLINLTKKKKVNCLIAMSYSKKEEIST